MMMSTGNAAAFWGRENKRAPWWFMFSSCTLRQIDKVWAHMLGANNIFTKQERLEISEWTTCQLDFIFCGVYCIEIL